MDRLDELALLVAILDTGSLAAASRKLRRSPQAVTRALAALESRAGTRLVERTTRKTAPTEAGRRLAEQARAILGTYGEAIGAISGTMLRGTLGITAPQVFGPRHVTPVVADFLALHPAVRVELMLADRSLDLIEEEIDLGIRIGQLADSGLITRRVGEVRCVVVASPSYLAAQPAPTRLADIAAHDIIFTAIGSAPLEWRFGGSRKPDIIPLAPRLVVNDVEASLWAARSGRGIARALSYQVDDDLAAGRLIRLLRDFEPEPLPVQIVVASARYMPASVRAFVDFAVTRLRSLEVLRPMR